MKDDFTLIDLMSNYEPLETFQKLFLEYRDLLDWGYLLHMCYCEESYESVGGDFGDEENPTINYARLVYLKELIKFLEDNGIKASESYF